MNIHIGRFYRLTFSFILILFAAHVFGSEEWSKEDWDQAFSRRNYQLGMTLNEFRRQNFPDQKYSPNAFPVCSNDTKAKDWKYAYSQVYGELKESGIVKCHYYFMSAIFNREESAELLAADWGTLTDFYFVKPDSANNFFLYQIVSTSKQPIYDELLQAYTAGMGSEPLIDKSIVQNRLGASFENVIAIWENTVSILRLEKYYMDLNTLGIVLTLKSLDDIVRERSIDVVKDRAKRL